MRQVSAPGAGVAAGRAGRCAPVRQSCKAAHKIKIVWASNAQVPEAIRVNGHAHGWAWSALSVLQVLAQALRE